MKSIHGVNMISIHWAVLVVIGAACFLAGLAIGTFARVKGY